MRIGLRELVFVLLLAAIPLGSWWFVFRPRNAREQQVMQQIELRQARLQDVNKTTGAIGDMEREIESLQKTIAMLQAKLPNEKEVHNVLQEVTRLAKASKLATKSVRPKETNAAGEPMFASASSGHAEFPIEVKLEGDFRGFYAFLLALENQPRIMRISRMSIALPQAQGTQSLPAGTVTATFDMTVFFERTKQEKA